MSPLILASNIETFPLFVFKNLSFDLFITKPYFFLTDPFGTPLTFYYYCLFSITKNFLPFTILRSRILRFIRLLLKTVSDYPTNNVFRIRRNLIQLQNYLESLV